MTTSDIASIRDHFPELEIKEQEMLAPYTHMKIGGLADAFVEITAKHMLFGLCSYCFQQHIPFIVIGGASNIIVPDESIQKLVIHNRTSDVSFEKKDDTTYEVTADSGVITALLANKTMEKSLTGFEYFIGVPGTIGGAIINNSHFSAKELIGNLVTRVEVCTIEGKNEVWVADALKFDYDYSVFHERGDVVLSATFLLKVGNPSDIQENVRKAAVKRTSTQPIGIPSSGCMYRNPKIPNSKLQELDKIVQIPESALIMRDDGDYQVAAGFLIDQAGLKGVAIGGAQVSEKHATYMINTGAATAKDVETLCQKVEQTIFDKYGLHLEREVFFLK